MAEQTDRRATVTIRAPHVVGVLEREMEHAAPRPGTLAEMAEALILQASESREVDRRLRARMPAERKRGRDGQE